LNDRLLDLFLTLELIQDKYFLVTALPPAPAKGKKKFACRFISAQESATPLSPLVLP